MKKWSSLFFFLFLCFSIELIGGWFTSSSVLSWYPTLKKASFNPPAWVFGPVWTLLYLMIALSGWLIFLQQKSSLRSRALTIYGIQLFLNFLWSYFFFFLRSPFLGLVDITLLLIFLIWTVISFWPLSRKASLLLIPYLLWTAYASILNLFLFTLN